MRKFIWIGLNKHFNQYQCSEQLTTIDVMLGKHYTFFQLSNRTESGNCDFVGEFFTCDTIHFTLESGETLNYMVDLRDDGSIMLLGIDGKKIEINDLLQRKDIVKVYGIN